VDLLGQPVLDGLDVLAEADEPLDQSHLVLQTLRGQLLRALRLVEFEVVAREFADLLDTLGIAPPDELPEVQPVGIDCRLCLIAARPREVTVDRLLHREV
jgi:hypothetical protein